ncbi:hypothetical protein LVJ94_24630 [Pendulispora rubella]|uniref:LamG domain-containing protein n=1 Tax=Pendulispora rubella TaxID=2741070 RepID=A0ABZ2LHK0_9BACT
MLSPRTAAAVVVLLAAGGCAQILGAEFDGATLDGGAPPVDASPVVDTGTDAQPVDPRSLDGLALWLSADVGVSDLADAEGAITLWEDRSGKGHSAAALEPSRRPRVLRDGVVPAPVIVFDRAQRTCLSVTWSAAGVSPGLTLFVVSRGDATNVVRFGPSGTVAFPWNANASHAQGDAPALSLLVATASGARETPRLGSSGAAWEVLSARLVAGDVGGLRTYRNGQLAEQASLLDAGLPAMDALTLGCAPGMDEFASAMVGEILVYTASLSDANRRLVEEYLRGKWHIQ